MVSFSVNPQPPGFIIINSTNRSWTEFGYHILDFENNQYSIIAINNAYAGKGKSYRDQRRLDAIVLFDRMVILLPGRIVSEFEIYEDKHATKGSVSFADFVPLSDNRHN